MNDELKKDKQPNQKITIEDAEKTVGILEKLANIFISIFNIFKTNKK